MLILSTVFSNRFVKSEKFVDGDKVLILLDKSLMKLLILVRSAVFIVLSLLLFILAWRCFNI